MNAEQARRILARTWIESAAVIYAEDGWENNPDIGQHDYEDIETLMLSLAEVNYPRALIEEAYELLVKRAEGETERTKSVSALAGVTAIRRQAATGTAPQTEATCHKHK